MALVSPMPDLFSKIIAALEGQPYSGLGFEPLSPGQPGYNPTTNAFDQVTKTLANAASEAEWVALKAAILAYIATGGNLGGTLAAFGGLATALSSGAKAAT